jgi:hypothetical protein
LTEPQGITLGVVGASSASLPGTSGVVISPYVKPRGPGTAGTPSLVVEGGADAKLAEFDAGRINLNSTARVSHTFMLCNATGVAVTLTRIQPSCECLSVTVDGQTLLSKTNHDAKQTAGFTPIPLGPGQKLPVTVSIDPTRVGPGQLDKWVFIYTNGGNDASAVLTLRGEATTGVTVGPASLDFGKLAAGSGATSPLAVTLDPTILAGRTAPRLLSSSPDILIGDATDTAGVRTTYAVSISRSAPIGVLYGSVSVVDPSKPATAYATVPVSATLTGPLKASVDMIVFGAVSLGKGGSVNAKLTGPAAAGVLRAESDNRNIQVHIEPGTIPVLHAELSTAAPAGPLNANVFVTTSTGLRLVLPVAADIVSPS